MTEAKPGLTIPLNWQTITTAITLAAILGGASYFWAATQNAQKVPDLVERAIRIEGKLDAILASQSRTNSRLAVLEFAVMGEVSEPLMGPLEGGGD